MHNYTRILVAVDIYSTYEPVIERAQNLAQKSTDISLLHVTPPLVHFEPYGGPFEAGFEDDVRSQSDTKLKIIAEKHGIPKGQVQNLVGDPAEEIHKLAEKLQADLIVVGTHGRSGLKLLLGSTANAVLHGVKCDVLAVKV